METQMQKTVSNALTGALEQQTKESPADTKTLAKWLNLQTHDDPQIEAMVDACGRFAVDFTNGLSPRWISFLGVTGTGKTHCGRRLWENLKNRSSWRRTEYVPSEIYWPMFVADLRAGIAYERLRDLFSWPVLFLDDIGAERDSTGFASENLNTLIGCRANRWTIITSNLMLEQLAAIDPRISDRMIRKPNIVVEVNTVSHSLRTT
jgi:DNA replication protein DnaC